MNREYDDASEQSYMTPHQLPRELERKVQEAEDRKARLICPWWFFRAGIARSRAVWVCIAAIAAILAAWLILR